MLQQLLHPILQKMPPNLEVPSCNLSSHLHLSQSVPRGAWQTLIVFFSLLAGFVLQTGSGPTEGTAATGTDLSADGEMGQWDTPASPWPEQQRVVRMCLFDPNTLPVIPVGNKNMNEGNRTLSLYRDLFR